MNSTFSPRLIAKVAAKNKCHTLANALTVELMDALKPFVGKKVIKTDSSLLESMLKITTPICEKYRQLGARVWRHSSSYSVAFGVSANAIIEGKGSTENAECVIYIGKIDGQIMTALENACVRPTDYSAEKIHNARIELAKAKAVVNRIENDLCGFGEWDTF